MMPKIDDNHDVFNAHLLQLRKQLLSATLLVSIVIPLHDAGLRDV